MTSGSRTIRERELPLSKDWVRSCITAQRRHHNFRKVFLNHDKEFPASNLSPPSAPDSKTMNSTMISRFSDFRFRLMSLFLSAGLAASNAAGAEAHNPIIWADV